MIKKEQATDEPVSEELQKKRELTERLLASNVVGGRRIKTLQSFRNHVTSHEYPVIVLFKTKDDTECDKVEQSLKKALIRSKGEFKLCLIDAEVIDEQLTKAFKIDTTPTVFLFYRASITQEFREAPSKSQIKEIVRSA